MLHVGRSGIGARSAAHDLQCLRHSAVLMAYALAAPCLDLAPGGDATTWAAKGRVKFVQRLGRGAAIAPAAAAVEAPNGRAVTIVVCRIKTQIADCELFATCHVAQRLDDHRVAISDSGDAWHTAVVEIADVGIHDPPVCTAGGAAKCEAVVRLNAKHCEGAAGIETRPRKLDTHAGSFVEYRLVEKTGLETHASAIRRWRGANALGSWADELPSLLDCEVDGTPSEGLTCIIEAAIG